MLSRAVLHHLLEEGITIEIYSRERIEAGLTTSCIGQSLSIYEVVDSTNTLLQRKAQRGEKEGLVVVAERQTRGRGRRGREWASLLGGLYLSILLRPSPSLPEEEIQGLTFLASLTLVDLIRSEYGLSVTMKWPNDVVLRKRKLAGILTQVFKDAQGHTYFITGIGLNVNQKRGDWSEDLQREATSLREELGRDLDLTLLLVSFLNRFDNEYRLSIEGTLDLLRDPRLIEYSSTLGRDVEIRSTRGNYQGEALEITDRGSLLVACTDGMYREFFEGDVSIR